jgi:hypothetical protein
LRRRRWSLSFSPWTGANLIERNTWLQEKLEHEPQYQDRAEGISNRSRTRLALRGHMIASAPVP